jgi:hypothetical protein
MPQRAAEEKSGNTTYPVTIFRRSWIDFETNPSVDTNLCQQLKQLCPAYQFYRRVLGCSNCTSLKSAGRD